MSFEINTNMTASMASMNANQALKDTALSLKKLSTGKKINGSDDDAAGIAISSKLQNKLSNYEKLNGNFQNSLSFLQTQKGIIDSAAKMLTRAAELKHNFHSITANQYDKENYDKEFKEIQLQLREMQAEKFNGVSLFASGMIKSLASASTHSSILEVEKMEQDRNLEIHRTGIFDSLFVERAPPSEIESFNTTGSGLEFRQSIQLKGDSGEISWDIDSISWPDKFTIMHGSDLLFEEIIGDPGLPPPFGPNTAFFADGTSGSGTQITKNIKVNFPLDPANSTKTLDFIVNKSNQVLSAVDPTPLPNVTWNANLEISYDKSKMSLTDGFLYSLGDFEFDEFQGFIDVMADALAQNGASQSRISYEVQQMTENRTHLESADSRITDTDYALESTRLARVNLLSQSSARMIGEANKLSDLALTIMGQNS